MEKKHPDIRTFFGIPAYGGLLHAAFCRSYLQLQAKGLIDRACHIDGDSLVPRARNNLTAEFLKSDCTHLLFIDTDIAFEPWHVERLIYRAAAGLPVVAGLYPKKQRELAWVMNDMIGTDTREDGLRQVKYAGTGFMLVSRAVFDRILNAYPGIAYRSDSGEVGDKREVRWDFWPVGVYRTKEQTIEEPGRYLSEDWFFCQRCEDLGIPIMMDMSIHVEHIGQVTFPLEGVPKCDRDGNPIEEDHKKKSDAKNMVAELDCPYEMERHVRTVFDGEYIFENPCKNGDLIMDIGANVGAFTRWANLVWPNSPIIALEPVEENFNYLKRNCGGFDNIKIMQAAVCSDKSNTTMYAGKNNNGEWSFHDLGHQRLDRQQNVRVEHPGELPPAVFYKIDAEGCEVDIVTHLDLSLAKSIVLEWHRGNDHAFLKQWFSENGWIICRDDKRSADRGILAVVKKPYKDSEKDNNY